jgi:hypothetical protein
MNQFGPKIDQMAQRKDKIFHFQDLPNLPKYRFWFENIPSGNTGLE